MPSLELFSLGFSSSADAPPEGPVSLELSLPEDASDSLEPSPEEDSLLVELVFLAVVEVEVVCTAAFSALVSAGGVMLGVLFGTASETVLLPQAPRLRQSSTKHATTARRALKAAPCAARRSGSR